MRSIFQKRCWQAPLLAGRSRPHGRPKPGELGLPGGLGLAVRGDGDKADRLLLPGDALLERKIPPAAQLEQAGLHLVAARLPGQRKAVTRRLGPHGGRAGKPAGDEQILRGDPFAGGDGAAVDEHFGLARRQRGPDRGRERRAGCEQGRIERLQRRDAVLRPTHPDAPGEEG